jgi:hypothetical protein
MTSPFSSTLSLFLLLITGLSACSADWEGNFPESYQEEYAQVHDCRPSAHPAANYITTWMSPEGVDAWNAMIGSVMGGAEAGTDVSGDLPVGTTLVKAQYSDENCTSLTGYTTMEKLEEGSAPAHGDWRWGFLDAEGVCNDCDAKASCSTCHSPTVNPSCSTSFPFVCTALEEEISAPSSAP